MHVCTLSRVINNRISIFYQCFILRQMKMSHFIHILSIQISTFSLELVLKTSLQQLQIALYASHVKGSFLSLCPFIRYFRLVATQQIPA